MNDLLLHRLRLGSGLVLFIFVLCHLANHAFGLISLPWLDRVHGLLIGPWRSLPGGLLLLLAGMTHAGLSLHTLYVKKSYRITRLEWTQLILGLAIPLLLLKHVLGTRIAADFLDMEIGYGFTLAYLWVIDPLRGWLQALALLVVWGHACTGLYFWLRFKSWFSPWAPFLGVGAVLLPTLALAGYVSAGNVILRKSADPAFLDQLLAAARASPEKGALIAQWASWGYLTALSLMLAVLGGRWLHRRLRTLSRTDRLKLPSGHSYAIEKGASILDILRMNGVAHASVCGGRGRCTTCRVKVLEGGENLPPPEERERLALERIEAPPDMRLACQTLPTASLAIAPLLPSGATLQDGRRKGGLEGSERHIVVLFLDLRGSTALSEGKLPYDVLFLYNQFFLEMSEALKATGGHYAAFVGDGLMAIYGLEGNNTKRAAQNALKGAGEMLARLEGLNDHLQSELDQPLRMGIGIHAGEAIVGLMGPPGGERISAIGDTVNTAARLESLCKEYDAPLVISASIAEAACLDLAKETRRSLQVQGKVREVAFYALAEAPLPP